MLQFNLGSGEEGLFLPFTVTFDGLGWRSVKGHPKPEHGNERFTWCLHARVPPGPVDFYIHEVIHLDTNVQTLGVREVLTTKPHTWSKDENEEQSSPTELHVRLPLATGKRTYKLYLYRHEPGRQLGQSYYVLSTGETNPRNAIVPPAGSGYPITDFAGKPLSATEIAQGLTWVEPQIWRWLESVHDDTVPAEDPPATEVEQQFAVSALAFEVPPGTPPGRKLEPGEIDWDAEEV
ncbi:hypothetical protein BFW01_g4684 [Lasiodiplodia theobromae]|uniref:Uncharacterized protein n=1 Tax=Lasiodiplodia theobromae TaxID=45133 RepID=A0A5N5DRR5_9PEZI|nr:Monooxygenase [Lasiodiplodia theobromae]KAB2579572.1 hypothetical protein DBV05_g1590 [Lasiodiplodia theobromae]KAF4543010.1 Monooxygenase [Lasiodiplodia theobromae]KAF9633790.1 hypothetical protein BFW01_g4684 [Lasiodiplodia theobromae]